MKLLWYWVRRAVLTPELLAHVENPTARKGSACEGATAETLKKYVLVLKSLVMPKRAKREAQAAEVKVGSFGVVCDGWTHDSEHYLATFATCADDSRVVKAPALSCSAPEDTGLDY